MSCLRILIMLFTIFLSACSESVSPHSSPAQLKIGVLPDEDKATLINRYTPLSEYLSKQLGVPSQLIIPANYEELLALFANKQVDLAYFGGFTFLQAHESYHAIPLVMRDIDVHFTSYFITSPKHTHKKLQDFKDGTFSFGSKLSTSGHLMPRYFLQKKGIVPEKQYRKIKYSGSHDKTAYWVRDSVAELGVVNAAILEKMLSDGRLKQSDIHIVWETPPYTDYVWAIQTGFDEKFISKIKNTFLSLSPTNPSHLNILSPLSTKGFLPASMKDFNNLHEISHKTGLLAPECKM